MTNKPILQRVPSPLMARVDAWASSQGVNRTVAINLLIDKGLQADTTAGLIAEIASLRGLVIKLATVHASRASEGAENG